VSKPKDNSLMQPIPGLLDKIRPRLGSQAVREILMAAHGLKTARLCIEETQALEVTTILEQAGMWVDLHDKKYAVTLDSGKGGWISGYGVELPIESPHPGYMHLYVGTDPAAVLAAKKAEHGNQFGEFGRLLGYPLCCTNFYVQNLNRAEEEQGDFLLPMLEASLKLAPEGPPVFPAWNNVAAQYFNYGLLSFFPCSFYCRQAVGIAKKTLELLRLYDVALASEYATVAQMPILYTEYEGVFLFRKSRLKGDRLHYDGRFVERSLDGVVSSLLMQGDNIKIISPDCLEFHSSRKLVARVQSPKCFLMLFGGLEDDRA
jgi:hypothetical protein